MKKITLKQICLLSNLLMALFATGVMAQSEAEPVTITILYNAFLQDSFGEGPAPLDVIQAEVAEAYPHITVELNIAPDDINAWRDQLSVVLTAQDGTIDIYGMDTPWVLEFGQAGWAVPLDEPLDLQATYVESGLDIFSYDDQTLAIPFWGSVGGLFYRTDILEDYGYEPPQTYTELAGIAADITRQDDTLTGFVWAGERSEALMQTWAEIFLGFGGKYFDSNGDCAINTPEGMDAVTFMRDLIESGLSPRQVTTWGAAEARVRFIEGDAIFLRHNADIVTWLDDPERSDVGGQWGVISNPAQPDGRRANITGGFGFAMNPYTDTEEATLAVMGVLASFEVQRGFARAWGPVQYYDGLYENDDVAQAIPNAGAISELLPNAASRPQVPQYSQVSQIIQTEIHSILTGSQDVETGLDFACQQIDQLQ
jgi:multiple sugar transport system substrate-binding protein